MLNTITQRANEFCLYPRTFVEHMKMLRVQKRHCFMGNLRYCVTRIIYKRSCLYLAKTLFIRHMQTLIYTIHLVFGS
jgi:hypothetical protein